MDTEIKVGSFVVERDFTWKWPEFSNPIYLVLRFIDPRFCPGRKAVRVLKPNGRQKSFYLNEIKVIESTNK